MERPRVLIVDDDPLILRVIERSMNVQFAITIAGSVELAIEALSGPQTFAAIVADLRMPGRDGLELLQYARTHYPDTVRVVLSGAAQLRDAMAAVNEGQVFRLLTKPFQLGTMRQALDASVEQHRLITAERTMLDETLKGSIKALTDMLAIVQPMAFGRAMRLREYTTALAHRIGLKPAWDVEVAALLSQIGSVTLDAATLDRWYHSKELSPYERAQVARLPEIAEGLLADIPRLDTVRNILRRQYEPFNAADLPIGAAILAIARDFDELITEGQPPEEALAKMDGRGARYSVELMNHFRVIQGLSSGETIKEMQLRDVAESMTFAADVYSSTGMLLIARGQRVTAALISRLRMQSFALEASMPVRMVVAGVA